MSVDLFVAVPAVDWPTLAAVRQCVEARHYPIGIDRFPVFDAKRIVTDGAIASVGGAKAYLEGELFAASLAQDDVKRINDRIALSSDPFRIVQDDAVMSIRVRSPEEMSAASYLISSLIVCFHGYGFEPQGNSHGREDFAAALVSGAQTLEAPEK